MWFSWSGEHDELNIIGILSTLTTGWTRCRNNVIGNGFRRIANHIGINWRMDEVAFLRKLFG
jgi:hypothetical protein